MADNTEHFLKLKHMYETANSQAQFAPSTVTISEGKATVELPIVDKYLHAAHAVHGSLYFKVMDDATFFAAQSLVEDVFILTTSFNLHFTRPVKSGTMKAVGKVVYSSRRLLIAEAAVFNGGGQLIGKGTGTFMPSHTPLSAELGYQ